MYVDRFYYIPERLDLIWRNGQIRTVPEFDEATKSVEDRVNPTDRYIYSPLVHTRRGLPEGPSVKIAGTDRQALLYALPVTHEIRLFDEQGGKEAVRKGASALAIHFLGCLLGWRCQFHDWWVDGRIPSRGHGDSISIPQGMVCLALEKALSAWSTWDQRDQTVFINALYFHNRTPQYEWDWERFVSEYRVLDTLYAVAKRVHRISAGSHSKRITALCDHFGLFRNDALVTDLVQLRNDLIHEVLWAEKQPGSADHDAFHTPLWLHRFNCRLALAILGMQNDYVRSNWRSLGQCAFTLRS